MSLWRWLIDGSGVEALPDDPVFTDSRSIAIVDEPPTGGALQFSIGAGNGLRRTILVRSTWLDGILTSIGTKISASAAILLGAKGYQGVTLKGGVFPVFKSATVASGAAVFHLTIDGLSTGAALFATTPIKESLNAFVSDATASYQMGAVWSNSDKTVTITVNKLTTANILTGLLGQTAANGAVINLQVFGS